MVTIPSGFVSREQVRPAGRVQETTRASGDAFGAGIGQSMQALASGINSAAEAIDYRDQIRAKADADDAYTNYMNLRRGILRDPESGYLNQTGKNALEGRNKVVETMANARAAVERGLSPRAQKEFSTRADALDQTSKDSVITHESAQLRNYSIQQSEAAIQTSLQEAELYYDDNRMSDKFLGEAIAETREAAALQGWPKEQLDLRIAELTSETTQNRAIAMAYADPVKADKFMDENKDRLGTAYAPLKQQLKPIVVEAKARQIVDPLLSQMRAGEDDAYGHPGWMTGPRGAESKTNTDRNPNSTAYGPAQFIEGTYLEYVNKVRAQGGATWADGLTREELLETRSDPQKEGEIYRAFRADNARFIERMGHEVTPRNEYAIHHFGQGGGGRLLAAENAGQRGMSIEQILSVEELDANPHLKGRTVGGVLNLLDRKSGGSRAVRNPAQAYDEAMKIEDPDVREAAIDMITRRMAVSEKAEAYEREQASDDAYEKIVTEGILPEDLPVEQQLAIGQNGMKTLMDTARAYQTGSDIHNESRYHELKDMAFSTDRAARDRFRELDLNDDMGNLSQAAFAEIKQMQRDGRQTQTLIDSGQASDVVYTAEDFSKYYEQAKDRYQGVIGHRPGAASSKEEMAQWNRFTSSLQTALADYANQNGTQMPDSMVKETVGMLLTPIIINPKGFIAGNVETALFDAPFRPAGSEVEINLQAEDIEMSDRNRTTQFLANAWGRPPTEDEVVEHYEREQLFKMGLRPEIDYTDIPSDIRRSMKKKYPERSEQELIDLYLSVMVQQPSTP